MKKSALLTLIILLISINLVGILLSIQPVRAEHTAVIDILPKYYRGGPETKIFKVTNLDLNGADRIVLFVVAFPDIKEGDTNYKPVDYDKPDGWKATYEKTLRQVIFESLDWELYYIGAGDFYPFKIVFEEGPKQQGRYEWTLTTSDDAEIAHTYYRYQWIDITSPTVTIDYPEDNSDVYATYEGWPEPYYLWTNGTVSDEPPSPEGSGVKHV